MGDLPAQPRRAGSGPADRRRSGRACSQQFGPEPRTCSSTAGASAGGWRAWWAVIRAGWSWPPACCSRCRGRRSCATATRSAWATTITARPQGRAHAHAVDRGQARRLLHCRASIGAARHRRGPVRLPAGQRRRPAPRSGLAAEPVRTLHPHRARNARSSAGATTRNCATGSPNVLAVRCDWRNNAVLSRAQLRRRGPRGGAHYPRRRAYAAHQPAIRSTAPPTTVGAMPWRWSRTATAGSGSAAARRHQP